MKARARRHWSVTTLLLFALGLPLFLVPSASSAQSQTVSPPLSHNVVPDIEYQFATKAGHGDPLAMHLGVGTDPSVCRHYQSINRVNGPDGTPYMLLTRSGTDTGVHCSGTNIKHFPGELLVVRMASRDKTGEYLRSNLLKLDTSAGDTLPPVEDIGVKQIKFNGRDDGRFVWPAYSHLSGAQVYGDVLVIPMEDKCTTEYEDGHGECLNDGKRKVDSGLLLLDVSNPEEPRYVTSAFNLFPAQEGEHALGVVGVAQILPGELAWHSELSKGGFLFALTWGKSTEMRFAYARPTNPLDLKTANFIHMLPGTWVEDNLGGHKDKWRDWQMMNFVRDTSGELYLIGGDKVINTIPGSPDMLGLFKVSVQKIFGHNTLSQAVTYVNENHIHLENPDMGSLEAAASIYVSPSGQLVAYTGPHDNDHAGGAIEMGEFRSVYGSTSQRCGPVLRLRQFV